MKTFPSVHQSDLQNPEGLLGSLGATLVFRAYRPSVGPRTCFRVYPYQEGTEMTRTERTTISDVDRRIVLLEVCRTNPPSPTFDSWRVDPHTHLLADNAKVGSLLTTMSGLIVLDHTSGDTISGPMAAMRAYVVRGMQGRYKYILM